MHCYFIFQVQSFVEWEWEWVVCLLLMNEIVNAIPTEVLVRRMEVTLNNCIFVFIVVLDLLDFDFVTEIELHMSSPHFSDTIARGILELLFTCTKYSHNQNFDN